MTYIEGQKVDEITFKCHIVLSSPTSYVEAKKRNKIKSLSLLKILSLLISHCSYACTLSQIIRLDNLLIK